ncbi:GIY-YIG nuclease family protein [Crossiella sp. SN42]|uniref:GIY-YIG nuclease family protein n=1 Tax=Crossiella sp. SN42 TaxID=2944808 RepID=UPI00207D124C|nr:GIY-YIG nuclease family protein [Crossiella sp. SN42]MCO1581805.1 GIY-YIG nuclease family protein [Crossiella sp. SN42]
MSSEVKREQRLAVDRNVGSGWFNGAMTHAGTSGATIRLFLVDGTPQGIRLVDRSQWTGVCLAFSRADYARARLRNEFGRTGVYLLTGPDPEGKGPDVLYIGEGDAVAARLDSHQRSKDFWTNAYVLTTADDSLNKAHVRYLEARLVQIAATANSVRLDNGKTPNVPWLSEPEVADMEAYLANMLVILPIVGVHAFEVPTVTGEVGGTGTPDAAETRTRYFLKTQLTTAEGIEDPRGFTVFEGALGRFETKTMTAGYHALREKLLTEGVLAAHGADQIRLTRTYAFDSPSSAASVLSGGSKNGRIEWRDAQGRTLREHQQGTAETPADAISPDQSGETA